MTLKSEELKKLKIVFIPNDKALTHSSICLSLAKLLNEKGHKVVIVVNDLTNNIGFGVLPHIPGVEDKINENDKPALLLPKKEEKQEGSIASTSFAAPDEDVIEDGSNTEASEDKKLKLIDSIEKAKEYQEIANLFTLKPNLLDNWIKYIKKTLNDLTSFSATLNDKNVQIQQLIDKYDPDIFVTDGSFEYNAINKTSKAWVWLFNGNPLPILNDKKLPPPYSGFSLNEKRTFSILARLLYDLTFRMLKNALNLGLMAKMSPIRIVTNGSPYLTLYSYPKELDYPDLTEWKSHFYRVDTFNQKIKIKDEDIKLPEPELPKFPEKKKIILVTMGSFHSANIKFMKTLLSHLAHSSHNFIIDKQYSPEEYQLYDNMLTADNTLKSELIEMSNLVITDGDNDTVVKTFSFGKPMIVLPFWLAQLDNAERIHETGYGVRLSPFTYSQHEILGSIEKLLNDKDLNEKLSAASKRIIEENRLDKAAELIENLGLDKNFYREDKF